MRTIELTKETRLWSIQLNHGKVNAIDTDMVKELLTVWREARKESLPPGIMLSGRPHCFSAGLDLFHQFSLDTEGIRSFWGMYHMLIKEIIEYPAPVICAITGYAPAGATILALCTDYRIMGVGAKHRIGMHEFEMSLQIPLVLSNIYSAVLGQQKAWNAVLNKRLFTAPEALEAGLIHEACEVNDTVPKARERMRAYLAVKPEVFAQTKVFFTSDLRKCVAFSEAQLELILDEILSLTRDMTAWEDIRAYLSNAKSK